MTCMEAVSVKYILGLKWSGCVGVESWKWGECVNLCVWKSENEHAEKSIKK